MASDRRGTCPAALRRIAEDAEAAWLNRPADEAESEGMDGAVSIEEMAALLRTPETPLPDPGEPGGTVEPSS
jgi:hypothetical protein